MLILGLSLIIILLFVVLFDKYKKYINEKYAQIQEEFAPCFGCSGETGEGDIVTMNPYRYPYSGTDEIFLFRSRGPEDKTYMPVEARIVNKLDSTQKIKPKLPLVPINK